MPTLSGWKISCREINLFRSLSPPWCSHIFFCQSLVCVFMCTFVPLGSWKCVGFESGCSLFGCFFEVFFWSFGWTARCLNKKTRKKTSVNSVLYSVFFFFTDDVPPYFKTEPVRSQLHLERNRLVLTCMAEGSWPLEFKWIHNTTELTRFSLEYRWSQPECTWLTAKMIGPVNIYKASRLTYIWSNEYQNLSVWHFKLNKLKTQQHCGISKCK